MFFRHRDNESLGHRLGIGLAVGLVVIFLLQTAVIWLIASRLVEQNVLGNLEHESETLLSMTAVDGNRLHFDTPLHALQYHRPFSGHYFHIRSDADNTGLRSRSLWDANLPMEKMPTGESNHSYSHLFSQRLLVLNRVYERDGQRIYISVAEEVNHQNALVRRLMLGFGVVFAITVFLLWLWQQWTLRHAMRVLQVVRQDMDDVWNGRRDRLPLSQTPEEILPMIEAFNAMLERLQQRMQRTRSALGDLAHSLKTPLASIQQHLDAPFTEEARESLQQASNQIKERIERELRIAQLAGVQSALGHVRVDQEAADLVSALATLNPDKVIQLHCPASLSLMADREDILELLGNLVDNACKWAKSRIVVRIVYNDLQQLRLTVEDDGPGMPASALPSLQQRGFRLDEQTAGHGLGLSIVAAIVREYNGTWEYQASEALGGALLMVQLPLRQHHSSSK